MPAEMQTLKVESGGLDLTARRLVKPSATLAQDSRATTNTIDAKTNALGGEYPKVMDR